MANSVTTQVIVDGPRNCIVKVEGVLDSSDYPITALIDPAVLAGMDNTGTQKAATFLIDRVTFNVEDGIEVRLYWDAPTPTRIEAMNGRGTAKYNFFGGLRNNATSPTGKISFSTEGWTMGMVKSFALVLELDKVGKF